MDYESQLKRAIATAKKQFPLAEEGPLELLANIQVRKNTGSFLSVALSINSDGCGFVEQTVIETARLVLINASSRIDELYKTGVKLPERYIF